MIDLGLSINSIPPEEARAEAARRLTMANVYLGTVSDPIKTLAFDAANNAGRALGNVQLAIQGQSQQHYNNAGVLLDQVRANPMGTAFEYYGNAGQAGINAGAIAKPRKQRQNKNGINNISQSVGQEVSGTNNQLLLGNRCLAITLLPVCVNNAVGVTGAIYCPDADKQSLTNGDVLQGQWYYGMALQPDFTFSGVEFIGRSFAPFTPSIGAVIPICKQQSDPQYYLRITGIISQSVEQWIREKTGLQPAWQCQSNINIPCSPEPCPQGYHWDTTLCKCIADHEPCKPLQCPPGYQWDATQCKCVAIPIDDKCCPKIEIPPCPDFKLPKEIQDCLCRIADAFEQLKSYPPSAQTFATGLPGRQKDSNDNSDEYWSGNEGDMPFAYSGGTDTVALDTLDDPSGQSIATGSVGSALTGALRSLSVGSSLQSQGTGNGQSLPSVPTPADLLALVKLDFNEEQTCQVIVQLVNVLGSYRITDLCWAFGLVKKFQGKNYFGPLMDMVFSNDSDTSVMGAFTRAPWILAHNLAIQLIRLGDFFITAGGQSVRCNVMPQVLRWLADLVNGIAVRWIGARITPLQRAFDYALTIACPQELPTPAEATEAYLTNVIDQDTWACWTRANDMLPRPAFKSVLARQERLTDEEIVRCWLRGFLYEGDDNPDIRTKQANSLVKFRSLMRQRGWLDDQFVLLKRALAYEIPSPSDLIHMMLRHVEDDAIVGTFKLYDEFDKTYKGQLKDWFDQQGVPESVAARLWAAHWANMPFGQLQEMLFRLRPEKYGDLKDDHGYPLQVTPEIIYQALRENDVPPFWRGKLIEIKYNLPRLIDQRNAYMQAVQGEDEYVSLLKDRGQRAEDIPWLLRLAKRRKRDALRRNQWVTLYRDSGIPAALATTQLQLDGYDAGEIKDALAYADIQRAAISRKKCIAGLRKRFLKGEISIDDVAQFLAGAGYDATQVVALRQQITCEFETNSKTLSKSEVCDSFTRGLIDQQTAMRQLQRLGLTPADAATVLGLCTIKKQPKKKQLTVGQICDAVVLGQMTPAEGTQRLMDLNYTEADSARILGLCVAKRKGKR